MQRVTKILAAGTWPAAAAKAAVTLAHVDRHRRRIALTAEDGRQFLLDEQVATTLVEGDGLLLDDGAIVAVRAADEDVCDVSCDSPRSLARLAWHLGNRHLAVELRDDGLRIRDDHVIVEMLHGLGAQIVRRRAPFNPESGAYHDHGQRHGHDDDHHH
ncbi:MAG TPA: urease accessory protein UreE [Alphaproteobacteria bacterium]|nr:urease accessory protein UreE [Alphaproteobacteria bacterium]